MSQKVIDSGLEFEVIQDSTGAYVAACHKERIYVEGNDLAELRDSINTAIDEKFVGRAKPEPQNIRLIVYKEKEFV